MSTHAPWPLRFLATFLVLTASAAAIALRVPNYRRPAQDFLAMRPGVYFNAIGLTRGQGGALKLGFAETHAPPPIGAFGNHCINYFGADAFGRPEQGEYFFNYSYANLSLPEIEQLMAHLAARQRLPRQLIIVQITAPNADNGAFIIDRGRELPRDIALEGLISARADLGAVAGAAWDAAEIMLHETLNYNTVILGLLQTSSAKRLTGPALCKPGAGAVARGWLAKLPWTIRTAIDPGAGADVCAPDTWAGAFRRDGSVVPDAHTALVRDQDTLREADRKLRAGDEPAIAAALRRIDAIGKRAGAKVVFLIPPVYESDRRQSVVNRVLDRALALAPEIAVIDDRAKRGDARLFVNYLHPSPAYFRAVAEQLRARGWLRQR